ncbi:type II toxin-antitoxin system PemK/MazF family toxin [Brochothrix thermosphacta]|uniref:type II toxin-antitoxin system PemK/MazF family toxin n=1 Tax=Brochothrix thermosphacta TaxID=2756 RepID=UPI00083FC04C|nr:type II toxin-antitoxin system PemK/MazF family toxin [Brochothrix thermosphacta]ODJ58110.1 PemK family transcriptional regulator [Brochothrix thermosphacta]
MIRRGEIYYADLSLVKGSEQGGIRPVLIIQNDIGNKFSPTVIVAAVTAKIQKAKLLTHVEVKSSKKGLNKNSVILLEQIRTIDKQRLTDRVTVLDKKVMKEVDNSLKISLSLVTF